MRNGKSFQFIKRILIIIKSKKQSSSINLQFEKTLLPFLGRAFEFSEIQCTQLSPRKLIGLKGRRIIYSFALSIFVLPLITSSPGPLVLFNPSALTSFTPSELMLKGFKLHLPSHCANCCLHHDFTYRNPLSRHSHFACGGGLFLPTSFAG